MCVRQLLSMLIIALIAVSAAAADNASDEIVAQLQKGGYVLFVRHPKTNEDQADVDPLHLDNIRAQRQLTDEGRDQARQLGAVLRSLRVPVAQVISSKFYRAQEAAQLLDLGDVTTSIDVTEGGLVVSPKENKRRAAALQALLATPTPEGQNIVIVSHKPNLQDAAGKEFGDMAEAEIAVFQSTAEGKFRCVGRYPADVWSTWKQ